VKGAVPERLLSDGERRRLPTAPGLCDLCLHAAVARSADSVFVRCTLSRSDPRYPRYPRLPVLSCFGFASRPPAADG
jgi:hypothetical protein